MYLHINKCTHYTVCMFLCTITFHPKRLTIKEYNKHYIIKRQTDTWRACNTISRQCSEQILARQGEVKGKRANIRKESECKKKKSVTRITVQKLVVSTLRTLIHLFSKDVNDQCFVYVLTSTAYKWRTRFPVNLLTCDQYQKQQAGQGQLGVLHCIILKFSNTSGCSYGHMWFGTAAEQPVVLPVLGVFPKDK